MQIREWQICISSDVNDCDLQIKSANGHSPIAFSGINPAKTWSRWWWIGKLFYAKRNQMRKWLECTCQQTEISLSGLSSVKNLGVVNRSFAWALNSNKKEGGRKLNSSTKWLIFTCHLITCQNIMFRQVEDFCISKWIRNKE